MRFKDKDKINLFGNLIKDINFLAKNGIVDFRIHFVYFESKNKKKSSGSLFYETKEMIYLCKVFITNIYNFTHENIPNIDKRFTYSVIENKNKKDNNFCPENPNFYGNYLLESIQNLI